MQTHFERIGGKEGVRRLVDRFYELMDSKAEVAGIRAMHAKSLDGSREKLFMFLSGWLGGQQLFIEKFGHPRLRQRHDPFAIGESERDQWMSCMTQAMQDVGIAEELRDELQRAFWNTADFMRNKEG
jgi:hemoglobin